MSSECEGCGCVKNYNNNSEFCGRLARTDKGLTTVGCNTECSQCKLCNYSNKNNKTPNVNPDRSFDNILNNYLNRSRGPVDENKNGYNNRTGNKIDKNRKPLNRKAFLEFLKRQQEMDKKNGFGKPNSTNNNTGKGNNNTGKRNNNTKKGNSNNKLVFDMINENVGYENMEREELQEGCLELQENKCTIDKGCKWSKENVQCSDLEVKFYSGEKTNGSVYSLKVGNYDLNEIENLDFYPEYIAVPKGLRVKIWKSSGFVGEFDAFLGNHDSVTQDDDLYPINYFGSLQICNMVTCSKPSEHYHLKLINVLSGNNIDEIEKVPVGNVEEYKKKLRNNIKNRLEYIKRTQKECLDDVLDYLIYNDINIKKNIDDEDNLNQLHRTKYILSNMPSCEKLIDYNKFYKEQKENEKKKLIKEECPKYLLDLKKEYDEKTKEEDEYLMSENNLKLLSPGFIDDLREKVKIKIPEDDDNRIFKDEDFKLIILISIVLLLIILVFILVKFLGNNSVRGNKKNGYYNNDLNNYNNYNYNYNKSLKGNYKYNNFSNTKLGYNMNKYNKY